MKTFCHLNCADLHLRCLDFNAPFFLQTKTLQNKMLKLTSRNISSTWQTQSTLLKEWVWTIHLAKELPFQNNIGKKFHNSHAFAKWCGMWDHATPPKRYCGLPKINMFGTHSQVELQNTKTIQLEIRRLCKRLILNSYNSQNIHWERAWSSRFDPPFLSRCVDLEYALRDHNF